MNNSMECPTVFVSNREMKMFGCLTIASNSIHSGAWIPKMEISKRNFLSHRAKNKPCESLDGCY